VNSPRKRPAYNRPIFKHFQCVPREATFRWPVPSIAMLNQSFQVVFLVQITGRERFPGFVHHQTTRCIISV